MQKQPLAIHIIAFYGSMQTFTPITQVTQRSLILGLSDNKLISRSKEELIKQVKFQSKIAIFPVRTWTEFLFDWPASVSNILTVRKWAEPKIVGRNFTS